MIKIFLKSKILKRLMARTNMSQKDFAERCKISNSYLSKIISNERLPSPKLREQILKVLGVPFERIFFIQDDYAEIWKVPPEKVKFGLITWSTVPFFVAWANGWRELAEEYGFELYEAEVDGTAEGFVRAGEELLAQGIDLLIESGNVSMESTRNNAENATKAGAIMISFSSPQNNMIKVKHGIMIGNSFFDSKKLGTIVAEYFKEKYPDRDPVILVLEANFFEEGLARVIGFKYGFKSIFPDMTIIEAEPSGKGNIWTRQGGYVTGKDALAAHPEINVVYAPGENYILGCLSAFEEAGRGTIDDELFIVFDTSAPIVEKLKDPNSALKISVALYPVDEAKRAFLMGMRILNDLIDWKSALPMEFWKVTYFTPDNFGDLDKYLKSQRFETA